MSKMEWESVQERVSFCSKVFDRPVHACAGHFCGYSPQQVKASVQV